MQFIIILTLIIPLNHHINCFTSTKYFFYYNWHLPPDRFRLTLYIRPIFDIIISESSGIKDKID